MPFHLLQSSAQFLPSFLHKFLRILLPVFFPIRTFLGSFPDLCHSITSFFSKLNFPIHFHSFFFPILYEVAFKVSYELLIGVICLFFYQIFIYRLFIVLLVNCEAPCPSSFHKTAVKTMSC